MRKTLVQQLKYLICLLPALLVAGVWHVGAQDFLTLGARGGLSFNSSANRFQQGEAFADFDLPWHWNFCSDWRLQPKIDASAGWLDGEHLAAFVGTTGPRMELSYGKFPLALEGGSNPTILSRDHFGSVNFGDRFQFTSYIGMTWHITDHVSLGYRFQHMSNAGLASPNPGLNFEMLELSYHF